MRDLGQTWIVMNRAMMVLLALAAGCDDERTSSMESDEGPVDAALADAAGGLEVGSASGIDRIVMSPGFDDERLDMHVTEVGPGEAAHEPHTHSGHEGFYVLSGRGELTLDRFTEMLETGQAAMFEARFLHGLRNASDEENLRYVVIKRD